MSKPVIALVGALDTKGAEYVIKATGIQGFVGASSMERLPVEKLLEAATKAFKSIPINQK